MLRHFKLAQPQSPSPEKFSENATIKAMEDQHHHGPQAQAQPWGVQQVPFIFIKMNI